MGNGGLVNPQFSNGGVVNPQFSNGGLVNPQFSKGGVVNPPFNNGGQGYNPLFSNGGAGNSQFKINGGFNKNDRKKKKVRYGDGSLKNKRTKTKVSSVALEKAGFPLVNYVNTAGYPMKLNE